MTKRLIVVDVDGYDGDDDDDKLMLLMVMLATTTIATYLGYHHHHYRPTGHILYSDDRPLDMFGHHVLDEGSYNIDILSDFLNHT